MVTVSPLSTVGIANRPCSSCMERNDQQKASKIFWSEWRWYISARYSNSRRSTLSDGVVVDHNVFFIKGMCRVVEVVYSNYSTSPSVLFPHKAYPCLFRFVSVVYDVAVFVKARFTSLRRVDHIQLTRGRSGACFIVRLWYCT